LGSKSQVTDNGTGALLILKGGHTDIVLAEVPEIDGRDLPPNLLNIMLGSGAAPCDRVSTLQALEAARRHAGWEDDHLWGNQ
jgi:hypothetical protein